MTQPASAATVAAMRENAPNVHNGTYTVAGPNGHFTVKLFTVEKGDLSGKRLVSLLFGPDNVSNYRAVAFWDDAAKRCNVWKRFASTDRVEPVDGYAYGKDWTSYEQKLAIWCDLVVRGERGYWGGSGYELKAATRCLICNRKLTTPESIEHGIGPVCAGKA